jgi:hypothetical protein
VEKGEKKKGRITRIQRVLLLLPSQAMVEQDWTPSKVTQGHMQNLTKQGFMTATELMACRVPEDPAFPTTPEGYMVPIVTFYEWEFSTPSHRFLRSLLQYYGLELHNLTPSGVLYIAVFMTV